MAAGLVVVYLVLVLVTALPRGNAHTGDTDTLVAGTRAALHCIGDGVFRGCGHPSGGRGTAVGPYGLLQYLPAAGLIGIGLSNSAAVRGLAGVNFIAFAGCLVLALVAARRLRPPNWGPLLVVALLASSLTYQSTAGFGEGLGAFVTLAAVVAALYRRPVLIAVTVALAATGRETVAPFVLVLALVAGRRDEDGLLPPASVLIPTVAGAAAGVIANFAFNVFRYGTYRNLEYLDPIFRAPGQGRKLRFLLGIWFSPANGVAWYWPVATALLIAGAIATALALIRSPRDWRAWLPGAVALAALGGFGVGLAAWYTPVGWIAYGPRLMVPLLPAALVVLLYETGLRLARWLARGVVVAAAIVAFVIVAGWPEFGAPWSYKPAIESALIAPSPQHGCPRLTEVVITNGPARYYPCAERVMWRTRPSVIWTAATATRGGIAALAARVIAAAACATLLVLARRSPSLNS